MDTENRRQKEVHVVAVAYPLQGHLAPLLQLAGLLEASGSVRVTFLHLDANTFVRLKLSNDNANIKHVVLCEGKRWFRISTSYPDSVRERVLAYEKLLDPFTKFLEGLHAVDPVTCILADVLVSWVHTAGSYLSIPGAALWTSNLSSLAFLCSIPLLASNGFLPIKDISGGPHQLINCIPRLPPIFTFDDLPSFFHAPSWPDDVLDFLTRQMKLMRQAHWIFYNSAPLECEHLLQIEMQKVYEAHIIPIGPLVALDHHHLLLDHTNQTRPISLPIRGNLWNEDATCLEWLNKWSPHSVLYISFGSLVILSPNEVSEILDGLKASNHPFLWALRLEAIGGDIDLMTKLYGFESKALVLPWVPQLDVLAHESIGGFLTHCGWNSCLESIAMGKPMLGLPKYAEQKMNSKLLEELQIGRRLKLNKDGLIYKQEVEYQVKLLMDKETNNILQGRCVEVRSHIFSSLYNKQGDSYKNIIKFTSWLNELNKQKCH